MQHPRAGHSGETPSPGQRRREQTPASQERTGQEEQLLALVRLSPPPPTPAAPQAGKEPAMITWTPTLPFSDLLLILQLAKPQGQAEYPEAGRAHRVSFAKTESRAEKEGGSLGTNQRVTHFVTASALLP